MKSRSSGCNVLHTSTNVKEHSSSLSLLSIVYLVLECPFEVYTDSEEFRGTIKSPPRIIHPKENRFSSYMMCLQKVICEEFGKYMLAKVVGLPAKVPLRKRYLPSGSRNCFWMTNGVCLLTKMDAPLDLDVGVDA